MNKNTIIIVAVVLVIIAGVGGFFGGMQYQKSQSGASGQFAARGLGQGRFGGQNSSFRPVRGQILSIDSNSLTVKLSDGSTKIVVLASNTTFVKSATAAQSDLKTGDTVNVIGSQNSDGSVTASDVAINPTTMQRPTSAPTGAAK
jgi:hypothetical protein